ncbi:MAG: ATP-binding protein [Candidatus Kapabacteria bacterium]|nr:ATP-binding protein [Candidatus Kapabacteria bacterium]
MNTLFNFDADPEDLVEQVISTFVNTPSSNAVYTIINYFLKIFLEFPGLEITSFYILNQSTYEFEYYQTFPSEMESQGAEIFEYLTDVGSLGTAVSNRSLYSNFDNPYGKALLVNPLISFSNIVGLLIMQVSHIEQEKYQSYYYAITLLSAHFANKLENIQMVESQQQNERELEQKIAERTMELLKSKVDLHEKFAELKANLTMALPHELRTPINQLKGNSTLLIKHCADLDPEDIAEMSQDIYDSTVRINRLFENYLYYANLELTAIDPISLDAVQQNNFEYYNGLVDDIARDRCRTAGREEDLNLNLVETQVQFSETEMIKLISELIDNSIKFSQQGTPIVIDSYLTDDNLILSITDHGRGMAPEQINNIDAYMQFGRKEHEQQGMGLGLAICRRIVDLHDGKLSIESELDQYTKVKILIHTKHYSLYV